MHTTLSGLKGVTRKAMVAGAAVGLVLSTTLPAFAVPTDASLTLGDSRVDETSTYTVDLSTVDSGSTIGCLEVILSTNFDGTGAVPGLVTTSSTLDSTSLLNAGGGSWVVENTTNGTLRAENTSATAPNATGNVVFGAVTNGNTAESSYFATVTTYTDDSCTTEVESVVVKYVYTNGQEVSVTVEPTLDFDLDPVAASQVEGDGETTTVATTDGTIPFGAVSTASNGVAAHDLSISTNAQAGYDVSVRYSQQLTNQYSDTIDNVSGDGVAFPAPGNEAFGYHLSAGSDDWQQFSSSNETVMTSAGATTGSDTETVTYQVGISSDTEAGTYTSTVIYTATPTY